MALTTAKCRGKRLRDALQAVRQDDTQRLLKLVRRGRLLSKYVNDQSYTSLQNNDVSVSHILPCRYWYWHKKSISI